MALFLVLMVIAVLSFFVIRNGEPEFERDLKDGEIIGRQLVMQQAAAEHVCPYPTTCPPGIIDQVQVRKFINSNASSSPPFVTRGGEPWSRMRSFSTGTHVISVYDIPGGSAQSKSEKFGFVLSGLKETLTPDILYGAGIFNSSDRTIRFIPQSVRYNPIQNTQETIETRPNLNTSLGTSGSIISNGAPAMTSLR